MAANFRIITNNPAVKENFPAVSELHEESVEGVYRLCRDAVHRGARLISHPLAGSVKPNESPYRSVVLSAGAAALDLDSLSHIEGAIQTLKKLPVKRRAYPERTLEDFRAIDLDLMRSAVSALPHDYHF
ncbi:MAG: GrdX family protein [Clostridiaceae bacterium]|nr:GrdX family protein [Eubacteriales bacterium]